MSNVPPTTHIALTLTADGAIGTWNAGCDALFGCDAAAAIGRPLDHFLAEEHRCAYVACMSELPTSCEAQEVVVQRPDGEQRLADMVLVPIYTEGERHAGSIAFFTTEPGESEAARVGRMPLRTVIDVLPGTFYVLRRDGSFVLWNKTLEQVSAMSSEQIGAANALDMYDLAERRVIASKIRDVFEHDAKVFVEANYRDRNGHVTPFLLCGARIECHGEQYLCGMGLDITQRRDQEERLRLRERALHATSSGLVITRCNGPDNPIEYANPAFERITGYSAEEVHGRDSRFMAVPGVDDAERAQLRDAIRERREVNVVFRNRRKNGDTFWNDLTITPVTDGRGRVTHFIGVINDVTAIKQRTAHLEHEVNHDALTGLANRTLLWDRIEHAIHMAQREKSLVATVLLDLNGFKQINDTMGHEAGDALLVAVARRLQSAVREIDTVARLSGDEFVLVLVNQPSLRYAIRMIERLRSGFAEPFQLDGTEVAVGASMGVALYPHDGTGALELIRAADTAMYHAKGGKRDTVHFYSPDMKMTSEAKLQMERDMHGALERDELFLVYQPKVCLHSGRIHGIEAFVRWRHPDQGVLLPAAFLPEAEENGMIIPFGNFVLGEACAFMHRLEAAGRADLSIAVNVSYREYSRQGFVGELDALLCNCQLAHERLELELREQGLNTNHNLGLDVLSQLAALGVRRSVDAFGDGMCDLNYLQKLPLSHLKIAKSAIYQISPDARSGVVAKALIDIGHDLGIPVIAKGVETREQMDFLKANGCDELQGMYFSEPLTESALQVLLDASPAY